MPITDNSGGRYYGIVDCANKTGLTVKQVEHRLYKAGYKNPEGIKKVIK